jgi:hypothetical protein
MIRWAPTIRSPAGQASLIGGTGLTSTSGGGLAISSTGTFYGTPTSSRFGTYNSGTGTFTLIANPAKPAGGAYGALSFDGNGRLYGLNVGAGSPPPTHLVTINTTTGAVTDLGASVGSLDAIAFAVPEPATASLLGAMAGMADAQTSERAMTTGSGGGSGFRSSPPESLPTLPFRMMMKKPQRPKTRHVPIARLNNLLDLQSHARD